jgi:hypothetical protein
MESIIRQQRQLGLIAGSPLVLINIVAGLAFFQQQGALRMKTDRLRSAISSVLLSSVNAANEVDGLSELVDFLVFEIVQSNVELPPIASEDSPQASTGAERSLEELEAMPITSILGPHLVDLVHISAQDVPLVIDEILDLYIRNRTVKADVENSNEVIDRLCELCERPAVLTQHHLIPRSEHDLFVKRGLVTLEECEDSGF